MKRHQTVVMQPRPSRRARLERRQMARFAISRLALVSLAMLSVFGLSGCRAVEAIFKVGVWFGVLMVVAAVAVVGGIAAMIMKRR